jgi:hypothetical protein
MLRFRGSDLRPVLNEAKENRCHVILVKDLGVYFMSERGERDANGRYIRIAYAVGCNPDVDEFDSWWSLSRTELGGDDIGEYFDVREKVFGRILRGTEDLIVRATRDHLTLETAAPENNS